MVQRIEFSGLSPELQQRVQNALTVREGDTLLRADWERLRESLQRIDEHLSLIMQGTGNNTPRNEAILQIMILQAGANLPSGRPLAVGAKVMESRVVERVPPVYPANARIARVQGAVQLSVTIAPDGRVQNAQILSGPALLTQAAVEAVSQWVFEPMRVNGQPVAVQTTVVVNFVLQ